MNTTIERTRPSGAVDHIQTEESASEFSISQLQEEDIPAYLSVLHTAINDIPGMSDEEKQLAIDSKTVESCREKLQDPEAFQFVAKNRDGAIIGILEGQLVHDPDKPEVYKTMGYTAWTGVKSEYRQHGIAKALKTTYEATCRNMGITYMQSFIKDDNIPSIVTNIRMGYRPDGHFPPKNNGRYYTKKLR